MLFEEQDTCFISFSGEPTEAYISDKKDSTDSYMVTVPDGGLGGFENAELPVHESRVFSSKNDCINFYIAELQSKMEKLEALRT